MALKTVVKVGNISNLSDARYCSGMGVDMLGFSVTAGSPNMISPKLYQEIRGWISGPKVVAEIYESNPDTDLKKIIEDYAPDYFELSWKDFQLLEKDISLPCIVSVNPSEVTTVKPHKQIAYFTLGLEQLSSAQSLNTPLLIPVNSKQELERVLSTHPSAGVALSGTSELRPGFKDYEALADILEALEEI